MIRTMLTGVVLVYFMLLAAAANAQQPIVPSPSPSPSATIADFAWIEGLWAGTLGRAKLEQYFSPVTGGVIVGVFRLVMPQQAPLLEFSVLCETPRGVELRVRHFGPALKPMEGSSPIVLQLVKKSSTRYIFHNPINARPKRSILVRKSTRWFQARSEIIRDDGSQSTIEVDWRRQGLHPSGTGKHSATPFAKNDLAWFARFAGYWRSALGTGDAHEFWLEPGGNVIVGALCWVIQGKAEGFEFFSLEPGDTALFGHTWQFGADLEIAADQQPIKARVVGGTFDSVDFSGTVQKNHFRETVKFTGDGRMHKDLKIFKPDGSTLRVIDLDATRVGARRQPDKERGIP